MRRARAAPPAELAVSRVEALLARAVSGARVPARGDGGVAVVAARGEQRGHDGGPTEKQMQAVVGAVVRNEAEGVLAVSEADDGDQAVDEAAHVFRQAGAGRREARRGPGLS